MDLFPDIEVKEKHKIEKAGRTYSDSLINTILDLIQNSKSGTAYDEGTSDNLDLEEELLTGMLLEERENRRWDRDNNTIKKRMIDLIAEKRKLKETQKKLGLIKDATIIMFHVIDKQIFTLIKEGYKITSAHMFKQQIQADLNEMDEAEIEKSNAYASEFEGDQDFFESEILEFE